MEWFDHFDPDNELDNLRIRMCPPRVVIDNEACGDSTLVRVESVNKHGILVEVVQVLAKFDLIVKKAYITSINTWFIDVFYVIDQDGKKITDEGLINDIQQSLETNACLLPILRRSVAVDPALQHTAIEMTGTDRPGLLSEVLAVLTDLNCNVVEAEVWTHNMRVACILYVTDTTTRAAIGDLERLSKIKELLSKVIKRDNDIRSAKTVVSMGLTHTERRLHQMMFADRDFEQMNRDRVKTLSDNAKPLVTVHNCDEREYSEVTVRCRDRPKLLFDIVCTLTDMQYVVHHATVNSQGLEAYQEYYIRHTDGRPLNSEAERQRVIHCLEAAIERRVSEGLRLELCRSDHVGLLSDATRIFRENGLSVTKAEIANRGEKGVNVFYVTDATSNLVDFRTVEAIRHEIRKTGLQVKENSMHMKSSSEENASRFSFGDLFKSKSEHFLHNLRFIKFYFQRSSRGRTNTSFSVAAPLKLSESLMESTPCLRRKS